MPIYEYECSACGDVFQVMQRITEDPITEGPDCKKEEEWMEDGPARRPCSLKKLLFSSAIKFEGDGWTPKYHN